jgi:hypothetical protein
LGIVLGVCFSGVGLTWLLAANRIRHLDPFASERNFALAAAFVALGLAPFCRFKRSPSRSFLSGITAWAILSLTYAVAELGFPILGTRLGAFHLFVLGCVLFGLVAVLAWIMNLLILLRHARLRQHRQQIALPYAAR